MLAARWFVKLFLALNSGIAPLFQKSVEKRRREVIKKRFIFQANAKKKSVNKSHLCESYDSKK